MYILIDDDKLIHVSWKLKAKASGINLLCFFNVEDFIKHSQKISKDAKLYIDSALGDNIKGEIVSLDIFKLGFEDISICSGFEDLDISKYPWIKAKITKKPPF